MKKSVKTAIIAGVLVLLTVAACILIKKTGSNNKMGAGMGRGRGAGGNSVVTVRSELLQFETLNDFMITNGEVESQSAIEVYPSMSGKISSVNVTLGSHVEKGDVIAYVDPSEPGSNYAKSPVVAPISGSIVSSPAKVGAKVSTTSAFTMIGDIENLQISASVPERYIAELKTGLKAEITLEAYPGVIFNASVSRVSPVVDKNSRTKEVILNFDKKDSRVNAGMFAKVKLYTSKYSGYVTVAKDAVVQDDQQSYLFIVNDDYTVSKRTVKLGKAVDSRVQITDNVMEGERAVVEGMLSLADGSSVNDIANPRPVEKETSAGEGNENPVKESSSKPASGEGAGAGDAKPAETSAGKTKAPEGKK
ncbi:MAG: efflux RND transporter periplasmic adaptor subunit [Treponema sp.]|nr:efflux RND transporter periplasmic adaptor subunit [Treponema sp.]